MPLEGRQSARHAELDCKFQGLTRDIHMYGIYLCSAVDWL